MRGWRLARKMSEDGELCGISKKKQNEQLESGAHQALYIVHNCVLNRR